MSYYERNKTKILKKYHTVQKLDLEWKQKRNEYYKNWYNNNRDIVSQKRFLKRESEPKKKNNNNYIKYKPNKKNRELNLSIRYTNTIIYFD